MIISKKHLLSSIWLIIAMLVATALFFALPTQAQDTGIATWFNLSQHGSKTASGERYDHKALTAGHSDLPFGSMVRVTNVLSQETVVVRINDRPNTKSTGIIDLSGAAARELGLFSNGPQQVSIQVLDAGHQIALATDEIPATIAEKSETISLSDAPSVNLPVQIYEQPTVPEPEVLKPEMAIKPVVESETGLFTLQIGSFSTMDGAKELAAEFREAWILVVEAGDTKSYRVYFNRFDREEPARTAQNRLWSEGHDSFLRKVAP